MMSVNVRRFLAASSLPLLVACAGSAASIPASSSQHVSTVRDSGRIRNADYTFTTIDDANDPTFNELLGINNEGKAGGFYGSGSPSHPSRGYTVHPPYQSANFERVNYPGAVRTVVTTVNDKHALGGYYVDAKGQTAGFTQTNRIWSRVKDPQAHPITELFCLNDSAVGVGFYTAKSGRNAPFKLSLAQGRYTTLKPAAGDGAVATGINGRGAIVGYVTESQGSVGFLLLQGKYREYSFPGATQTQFFGITVHDVIVGAYVDNAGATHGLRLSQPVEKPTWESIDEPNAVGTTIVTGINLHGTVVGYYVDGNGYTNGFLATAGSGSP